MSMTLYALPSTSSIGAIDLRLMSAQSSFQSTARVLLNYPGLGI
jgi:hypothetical protein